MLTEQLQTVTTEIEQKINGVVIGLLLGITETGEPMIAFPGNPEDMAVTARSTTELQSDDVGQEVALLFEDGNPKRPLIIGKIYKPAIKNTTVVELPVIAELDQENINLTAQQSITLKCGKASITLTKAGKIILRGTYLLSRSSGVNRIKGGSVQIN